MEHRIFGRSLWRLALFAVALTASLSWADLRGRSQAGVPSMYVGPNIRVSTDSDGAHFEPMVWSSGNGLLVASSNVTAGDGGTWITKGYVSRDNGNTWFSFGFPQLIYSDTVSTEVSGDSVVAAGANNRLFFAALANNPIPRVEDSATFIYHSDDRGHTWSRSLVLQIQDHERFLTDPARKLVLIAGKGVGKPERLVVYVSFDNGTTFSKPVTYARVTGIAYDPCQLADGSVFLPFLNENVGHFKEALEAAILQPRSLIASPVFRLYQEVQPSISVMKRSMAERMLAGNYAQTAYPAFLSHGNIIYSVSGLSRGDVNHVAFRKSVDRGHTWSAPRDIAPQNGRPFDQFAASAAISTQGILGVAWAQMLDRERYKEWFSASTNGGRTFLPAQVISSGISNPINGTNLVGTVASGGTSFFQYSGFTTRPPGGDYFGMTVDPAGVFHPLWIDSRDGIGAQVYTTTVSLLDEAPSCVVSAGSAVKNLTKTLQLVFDPPRMNLATKILTFPVRLRNTGTAAVTGPVTFTVKKVGGDEFLFEKVSDDKMPHLTNAANGRPGVGATFDFSHSFGDFDSLPPQGVSDPVDLHLRLSIPFMAEAVISGAVTGRLCEK